MGHLTSRDAYRNLSDRINWFTQGAPESETLYKILQVLYTEKEELICACFLTMCWQLPICMV